MVAGKTFRTLVILTLFCLLAGCKVGGGWGKSAELDSPQIDDGEAVAVEVEDELKRSAMRIQANLEQLAALRQKDFEARHPRKVAAYKTPAEGPLGKRIPMKWNGSLEMGIKAVAKTIGWNYEVSGRRPIQSIVVQIDSFDMRVFQILESFGWQAGENVEVVINETDLLIKIIYLGEQ